MKTILPVAIFLAASLPALAAFAQDSHSHGSSSSERRYSEEEIKSRLERIDGYLQQLDKNRNGMLDADEVTGDQRRMADYLFGRAGIEFKVPISIAQLRQGAESYYRGRSANATPPAMFSTMMPFGISTTNSASTSGPQVYGFAGGASLLPVLGFGVPALGGTAASATASAAKTSAGNASTSKPGNSADPRLGAFKELDKQGQQRIRDMAAALMRKYAKDANKIEKAEWDRIGGFGPIEQAAGSHGDHIHLDGLYIHLADSMKRGQLPVSLSSGGWQTNSSSQAPPTKSGRFLTAAERLPKGLPSWFVRKDVDGDGQVTMAEFAQEWNRETVALFERYDLNHDGVITAEECLKAEKSPR